MDYLPTIGLEIHAELKTQTKMFCNSKNDADESRPNVNICPVCMGHPGTLPVINKEAVRHVLKIGLAVSGELADFTEFDRKNYFYPDIPKGYQISQYKYPLVKGGELAGVKLTRIHLEEDTGTLIHADENQRISADKDQRGSASLVNFNRAGVPLMELVTEPVIHSALDASKFAKELQLLLGYLGIAEANMEKGEMRVEANISVAQINADENQRISADKSLLYEDLTYKIRGAVFAVRNELGSGHKELIYQRALEEEFKKNNIPYEKEKSINVLYENTSVGLYRPDFVVDKKVILEIKAISFIGGIERKQLWHYLKNSGYRLALLVNFSSPELQIERVVFDTARSHQSQIKADLNQRISADKNPRPSALNQRQSALGVKVEVKNLNSFRSVERAIDFEIKRHIELLEAGKKVVQETRGWDEAREKTFSQRKKEDSHDYRYFPDPDLPKLYISEIPEFHAEVLKKELPELPSEKRERYKKTFNLKDEDIEIYVGTREWGNYFEEVITQINADKNQRISADKDQRGSALIKLASNYISSDLLGLVKKGKVVEVRPPQAWGGLTSTQALPPPKSFAALIQMIADSKVSSRGAKDILKIMFDKGGEPSVIAEREGLIQKSDEGELKKIVLKIIADNPAVVSDYKAGKQAALQFLVGQGMKATKGSANPEILKKIIISTISQ